MILLKTMTTIVGRTKFLLSLPSSAIHVIHYLDWCCVSFHGLGKPWTPHMRTGRGSNRVYVCDQPVFCGDWQFPQCLHQA